MKQIVALARKCNAGHILELWKDFDFSVRHFVYCFRFVCLSQLNLGKGEITELSANVTLFQHKILQLQVHWQDNLPNGE